MSLQVSELNGVKIYNLSAGKTTPEFLLEAYKKHKSLRYNEEYKRRIEVIQDFDFPSSCNQINVTEDQQYIVATGIYKPSVKIYEISEVSLKCEKGLDSECVKFCNLTSDYSKIAYALSDRNIEFHAAYGRHYKTRIPKVPRNMVYNPFTCDLIIAASSNEIYRISLDEGQFLQPFSSACTGVNALDYNKYLNLTISGGNDGIVEFWDYRTREKIKSIVVGQGDEISEIKSDGSGLVYGVGSVTGKVNLYDIRYEKSLLELSHRYKTSINSIEFHEKSRNIMSSSGKQIRFNNKDSGALFTSIEPKSKINSSKLVPESGMILVAQDCPKMGIYFLPQLDNAPKWLPYLENLTEEMEEEQNTTVYDEFRFLTREEIDKLNCSNLIGTKMLRSHLHGFLMHSKLYKKLKAKNEVFEYQEYKHKQIEEQMDKMQASRITKDKEENQNKLKQTNILFNKEFAQELVTQAAKTKNKTLNPAKIIQDERFKAMFQKKEFEIDKNSEAYLLAHPSERMKKNKRIREQDDIDEDQEQAITNFQKKDQNLENGEKPKIKNITKAQLKTKVIQKEIKQQKINKTLPIEKKIKLAQKKKALK